MKITAILLLLFCLIYPTWAKVSLAMLGFRSEGASLQQEVANELFRLLDAEKRIDVYPLARIDSIFRTYQLESKTMARYQLPFLLKTIPAHIYIYGKLAREKVTLKRYWWFPLMGKAVVTQTLYLTVLDGIRGEYRYIGSVQGEGRVGGIYMGVSVSKNTFLDPMLEHQAIIQAVRDVAEESKRVIVLSSRGMSKLSDSVSVNTRMTLPQVQFQVPKAVEQAPEEPQEEGVKVDTLPTIKSENKNVDIKVEEAAETEADVKKEDDQLPEEFLLLQEGMKW